MPLPVDAPSEHASLGCKAVDDLIQQLARAPGRWRFDGTQQLESVINERASLLGINPAPIRRIQETPALRDGRTFTLVEIRVPPYRGCRVLTGSVGHVESGEHICRALGRLKEAMQRAAGLLPALNPPPPDSPSLGELVAGPQMSRPEALRRYAQRLRALANERGKDEWTVARLPARAQHDPTPDLLAHEKGVYYTAQAGRILMFAASLGGLPFHAIDVVHEVERFNREHNSIESEYDVLNRQRNVFGRFANEYLHHIFPDAIPKSFDPRDHGLVSDRSWEDLRTVDESWFKRVCELTAEMIEQSIQNARDLRSPGIEKRGMATQLRLYPEQTESFDKAKSVSPEMIADQLGKNGFLDLSEDTVQRALEKILGVPFHKKDWGGETNDLYADIIVNGRKLSAAFLLKGNGLKKKQMEIADCGTNGDQLVRLFHSPALLFVVQYVGAISENLIKDIEGKVRERRADGREAWYMIIDGQETARLMHAYKCFTTS